MPTILTLTMNPAVDVSTTVPHVVPDRKLRCEAPRYEPGGGGINVARAAHRLGVEAEAWFPAGGAGGELLQRLLDAEGIRHTTLPAQGWTRENVNVLEQLSGRQFRFCMPGAALAAHEWPVFLERLRALSPAPDFVVASGSLPPGVPVDFYAQLARSARDLGSRLVLDSSGPALACAVEAGVYLLKPSLGEFRALTGGGEEDESALIARAVEVVVRRKWCSVLLLSLGSAGALLVTADERQRFSAPAVPTASTVGAGDSMVAGMLAGLCRGRSLRDAARFAVAAGAAAVMNPGTELCHRRDVERLDAQVRASAV
ncbi:MAG: 1-phosphofructokinase family hexose kinase [Deltaproteobacteria bacterium]|nr:1-phosphofructokinase family hexose kinase [Deltaproteobacteria bacterium]